jgi:hypothetical protein
MYREAVQKGSLLGGAALPLPAAAESEPQASKAPQACASTSPSIALTAAPTTSKPTESLQSPALLKIPHVPCGFSPIKPAPAQPASSSSTPTQDATMGSEPFNEKDFELVTVGKVTSKRNHDGHSMRLSLMTEDGRRQLCIRVVESEGVSMLDSINGKECTRCVPRRLTFWFVFLMLTTFSFAPFFGQPSARLWVSHDICDLPPQMR